MKKWHNEPPDWKHQEQTLSVTSGLKTDFWRKTHYGFIRDNGHFYYQEVTGNFRADVKIIGKYEVLYDQAGLMIRENDLTWLKCGIEFVNDVQYASAVVTRDYSDWSVVLDSPHHCNSQCRSPHTPCKDSIQHTPFSK
jgi:regulation of enolase protein 1 (concanavalin A-like superfamily)